MTHVTVITPVRHSVLIMKFILINFILCISRGCRGCFYKTIDTTNTIIVYLFRPTGNPQLRCTLYIITNHSNRTHFFITNEFGSSPSRTYFLIITIILLGKFTRNAIKYPPTSVSVLLRKYLPTHESKDSEKPDDYLPPNSSFRDLANDTSEIQLVFKYSNRHILFYVICCPLSYHGRFPQCRNNILCLRWENHP